MNKQTLTLTVGLSEKLTATVAPTDATNKAVTWSATGTAATVAQDGTVTAAEEGETIVTVTTTDGNKTAQCVVTVTP